MSLMRYPSFVSAVFFAALVPPLAAQNALYVENGDSFYLVRKVVDLTPYVEKDGKLVPAAGHRYLMRKVEEYVPLSVTINHLKASFSSAQSSDSASSLNNNFHFQADFDSPYRLDQVFLVLDLQSETKKKRLFVREIGKLGPQQSQSITITVPLDEEFGPGRYTLHIFADGQEIFHSKMSFASVERTIDGMIAKRIAGVQDAMPKPFVRPAPVYPEALRKANVSGKAVIGFTISPLGRVQNLEVRSASDSAFGEAALAAMRLWRFLPRVKDGRPVKIQTELPFSFSPPADKT